MTGASLNPERSPRLRFFDAARKRIILSRVETCHVRQRYVIQDFRIAHKSSRP